MLRRKLLVILASLFAASSAGIEYGKNEENWTKQEPFQIIMSWYLNHAYAVTVHVIHSNEEDSVYHQSSKIISVIHEKGSVLRSVVVTHHAIGVKNYQKSYEQNRPTFDKNKPSSNIRTSEQMPNRDLLKSGAPELFSYSEWQNLMTYGDCITILLIPDEATFKAFLNSGGLWRRNKVKRMLIIVVPESLDSICQEVPEKPEWKKSVKNILKRVWSEDNVLNIFLSAPTSPCIKDYLFFWDPFATNKNGFSGKLKRLKINPDNSNVSKDLSEFSISMKNMNGYPLKVTIFERSPTVLGMSDAGLIYESEKNFQLNIDNISGLDGLILKTLSSRMNCSVELYPPSDGKKYGYRLENGTFVGVIGDIVYRRVDFAANGVFLKDYQTDTATEFTIPISCESVCIAVPRAGVIPQWRRIFQCFSPLVWTLLFFNVLIYGLLRHVLRRLLRKQHPRRNLLGIVIETALIFVSSPQILPKHHSERILVGFYLLFSVIIVGTFQGTLYEGFTNPDHYKNIDTLEELDNSGLRIGTSSPNLLNIFGNDEDSPTLTRLRHKLQITEEAWELGSIGRTALKQDIAGVERKNDLELSINIKYLDGHGEQVLHIVQECPRTYNLAFMVPSGAFFLGRMNVLLRRMVESGLAPYWYNSTVELLIVRSHYAMAKKIEAKNNTLPFNLKDIQISFIVLISGLLLSILVFIGENVISRRKTPRSGTIPKITIATRSFVQPS